MKGLKFILTTVFVALAFDATAQFSQLEKRNEFMLKLELGYAPFMLNVGEAGDYGYYLSYFQNTAQFNAMAGANISQDWFLGGGAGFNYFHNTRQNGAPTLMGASVFFDADFRPIWQGLMGLDYQPATIKWAPEIDARIGASVLMGEDKPAGYGMTITPMLELNAGVNWYYMHGLRNMQHNWHSFYATIGVAYMQQTVFLPVRIGWRW